MGKKHIIGVVGNPNCGKSTLFNALTGARQTIGNWPGVTVERKLGQYIHNDQHIDLVDLPGTYSLDVTSDDISLDEKIARDFVHANEADLIVNIVDASNLERNLYLTSQLIEMKRPMVVVLNMIDAAQDAGMKLNATALEEKLGCPVVEVIANKGQGIDSLKDMIDRAVHEHPIPTVEMRFDTVLSDMLATLAPKVEKIAHANGDDPVWLAARLLEGDSLARALVSDDVLSDEEIDTLCEALPDDVDILLADARYSFAHGLVQSCLKRTAEVPRTMSDKIDRVVLNRLLGIPLFLLMMYLMFMFTINIGGAFIDFFDLGAQAIFVDGFGHLLSSIGLPEWLVLLLADGVGGGIQVVATFIPVIAFLYLFLSTLEDSGYMARAAFVMDRAMRAIGLPGKSFVPLIVGFGCNVPAIMATRTLEHERDRLLTILMAPFMSCGARLPVYALFAAAFFPVGGQNLVFGLYLVGIAIAVLTGYIMKNTLLRGDASPFVMELPPYRKPTFKGVGIRVWDRTMSFVRRAGRIIVPMVLVLNVMNAVGTDGSLGNEDSSNSVLAEIGKTITPAFAPMGMEEENWPAAVGIFTGVMAKEAVVGTLDSLYGAMAGDAENASDAPFSLAGSLHEALLTIPANLSDAMGNYADPLGLSVGDIADQAHAAAEQEVHTGTFGAMVLSFDGKAGAFAYLLFILLYAPCTAALAAIYREIGMGWAVFVGFWTTGVAYGASTIAYQALTFGRDPISASLWIFATIAAFLFTLNGLKRAGLNRDARLEQQRKMLELDGMAAQ